MTDPIQKPKGTYKNPPNGTIPEWRCPNCNCSLEHFKRGGSSHITGNVGLPAIIPLPPSQALIDSGDVFVPATDTPRLNRPSEQMQTGQANQAKALTHVIPGMASKVTPPTQTIIPVRHPQADALTDTMDQPVIGGKVTICVLLYGKEHHGLHRRCLNSIVSTVPPSRMDLRVATNQIGLDTVNYLKSLPVTKIYNDDRQRRKYPAMREMFYDTQNPINTNYVVWFDDDSYVRDKAWLAKLCACINAQDPKERVGMFGAIMYHPLRHPAGKDPKVWFQNAKWFTGKMFRDKRGRGVPNGMNIHFCVGGFWAISLEAIRACDIPDNRLNHNGGDILHGEQLYQGGYLMKSFNAKKELIHTSNAPRRGFKERFPWYR